ncbi:2-dehydropantoate 2-reductase [Methylomicrobium sp. Wu6]|uniref:ketopantoate reductase family protein n=1 Tax=Methylomicrobium sp. Wu6 TaxID=3107928 RepID=UPI002DD625A5|nr:2-dehydropantoate 2-reductase [Methylomicrobium sp. Wu6]MEC4747976.1 2-dehydropantoate 2-reductase [Methylomicrobium sp. Wu6]
MVSKVLVVGAGAIGAFYGSLLAKAGAEVSVVCRSEYETVKKSGFTIESASLGNYRFMPKQVLQDASDYQGPADYVLLCTKMLPDVDQAALLRPVVAPQTVIVFIQNGVDIEQKMLDAFPANEVVSGLAFICCNRIGPGIIRHLAYGRLALGNLPGSVSAKTRELCRLFQASGIESNATNTIVAERWLKCVWNAPFNPLSVLSDGLSTAEILHTEESFVRHIMQDICRIAEALGHPLPVDAVDRNIEKTYLMPPYKTSMLLDYEQGRPLEIEAILGNALRAAQRVNVPCPYLESIYALIRLKLLADRKHRHATMPSSKT